jgi:hypothetical protein
MSGHFVQRCREHDTLYAQCRCFSSEKEVRLVDCIPELCIIPEENNERDWYHVDGSSV